MRFAALVLTGCWSASAPAPVAPDTAATNTVIVDQGARGTGAPASSRGARREGFPRHSVWEGTYVCNQGLSSVTLTVDVDAAGNATARYDFGPVPSNPTVPNGSYLLSGVVRRQDGGGFAGDFEPTEWITHPTNYFMVPLSIESADGKTLTGTIRHPSCKDFVTTRVP